MSGVEWPRPYMLNYSPPPHPFLSRPPSTSTSAEPTSDAHKLSIGSLERFSRHLMLPGFGGQPSQVRLEASAILVVGAGGIGSTLIPYLAAAGVGRIALVDDDVVEMSNLQRQIIHTEASVGVSKAVSAAKAVLALNSKIDVIPYVGRLDGASATDLMKNFDVCVDCTDNPATRYMLSDVCAAAGKPCVSSAAIRSQAQVTVYSGPPVGVPAAVAALGEAVVVENAGACMRCVLPKPPPRGASDSCRDAGVLGPVPGLAGCFSASETIKVLTGMGRNLSSRFVYMDLAQGTARVLKLKGRQSHCVGCGGSNEGERVDARSFDYGSWCTAGSCAAPPPALPGSSRLTPWQWEVLVAGRILATETSEGSVVASPSPTGSMSHTLPLIPLSPAATTAAAELFSAEDLAGLSTWLPVMFDVRGDGQRAIYAPPSAHHVPWGKLEERKAEVTALLSRASNSKTPITLPPPSPTDDPVGSEPHSKRDMEPFSPEKRILPGCVMLCRRGNASRRAIGVVRSWGLEEDSAQDIEGGLASWAELPGVGIPSLK